MGNKKEKTKKLLEDFTEKCKELDVQYLIAVGSDISIRAESSFIANAIMDTLKGLPAKGRHITITLLLQLLEKEIEEE